MSIQIYVSRTLSSDMCLSDTLAQHLRHCTAITHYTVGDTHHWIGTRPGWHSTVSLSAHWPHEVATIKRLIADKDVTTLGSLERTDGRRSYGERRWREEHAS